MADSLFLYLVQAVKGVDCGLTKSKTRHISISKKLRPNLMNEREDKILIAGTFTNDLESGRRMKQLLDRFKPDVIVGETSQLLDMKASTREMVWAVLFDEYEIPSEIHERWKALQTHKEHIAAQNYSTAKRVPYYMIDKTQEVNPRDIEVYAQIALIEELKTNLSPEDIRDFVREMVDRKFYQLQWIQNDNPSSKKYYSTASLLKGGRPFYTDERGSVLAQELQIIMDRHSQAKILGFFDGAQVVKPTSIWATQALERPLHNVRYHVGEDGITYGQLVDLI